MIKRIRVIYYAKKWLRKDNLGHHVICDKGLRKWWDIGDATELNIVVSDEPHESAYKCERIFSQGFHIFDEITGRAYSYGAYLALAIAIRKIAPNPGDTFYLGIEVVK